MSTVVTFGEVMARVAAPSYRRLMQAMPGSMEVTFAGAEGNVAAAVALLGGNASLVTVLPDNPVGDACASALRAVGIDTSRIQRKADSRLGVYYVEHGANQRGTSVVYDRDGSAIATYSSEDYDWSAYLENADWFHVTGITPAISQEAATATLDAVRAARSRNVTVSCDLNFRGKLWRWDPKRDRKQLAGDIMSEVLQYVDIVVGNEGDADDVLGIRAGKSDVAKGKLDIERYPEVATKMLERFPHVSKVAITLRESISASHNRWGAMLHDRQTSTPYFAPLGESGEYDPYEIRNIVDRVGAGDAFCGSLIYALRDPELSQDLQTAVEFGVAAGALCHSVPGDFNYASREELLSLASGVRSGRVKR
jgi:2-dehydro-3-deoxygluconokinase